MINARRNESSLTAAVRVFILAYFMAAATEEGHVNAGHGTLRDDTAPDAGPNEKSDDKPDGEPDGDPGADDESR